MLDRFRRKRFNPNCCGEQRGWLNGILICYRCDFDQARGTRIPNTDQIRDLPKDY